MKKLIIVTDLDGTLLDPVTYSFSAAMSALKLVKKHRVPLVICSSKTRSEIEYYRDGLEIADPFIAENGGAVYIPHGHFKDNRPAVWEQLNEGRYYWIIRLGEGYENLRKAVRELQDEGFGVWGFGDMTPKQVALLSGFPEKEAIMACDREFDEPFLFDGDEQLYKELIRRIKEKGLNVTRAAFHHILGNNDKGKALSLLIKLYKKKYGDISVIAIGDSPSDLPMLRYAHYPVIVEKHGGGYDPILAAGNFERTRGVGPAGWNRAILKYLDGKAPT